MTNKLLGGVAAGVLTIAILAGVGLAAYDAGRDDRTSVQVSETAGTTEGGGAGVVVIDRDGHRGGFFLFPLFLVGGVLLFTSRRRSWGPGWGPRGGNGPCGPTGSPHGLKDWHRRAHDSGRDNPSPISGPPSAT